MRRTTSCCRNVQVSATIQYWNLRVDNPGTGRLRSFKFVISNTAAPPLDWDPARPDIAGDYVLSSSDLLLTASIEFDITSPDMVYSNATCLGGRDYCGEEVFPAATTPKPKARTDIK